jgi:hypothetical protein
MIGVYVLRSTKKRLPFLVLLAAAYRQASGEASLQAARGKPGPSPKHPGTPPRQRPRDRFPTRPILSSRCQRVQRLGYGRRRTGGHSLSAPPCTAISNPTPAYSLKSDGQKREVSSVGGGIANQEGIVCKRRSVPDRRSWRRIIFASFGFSREAVLMLIGMALLKLESIRPGVPLHFIEACFV